jgi:hypothetical protein
MFLFQRMSMEDLKEEKICLQKALIHFETLHGRPVSGVSHLQEFNLFMKTVEQFICVCCI